MRTRRVELGLSQERLAERAQINQSTVSLLERGDQMPTLNSLIQLTQALDISMDWLLGITDELKFITGMMSEKHLSLLGSAAMHLRVTNIHNARYPGSAAEISLLICINPLIRKR
ncbi:MAG: helix-turn-helix transcriptional regulator [Chloroflexota bacterium]